MAQAWWSDELGFILIWKRRPLLRLGSARPRGSRSERERGRTGAAPSAVTGVPVREGYALPCPCGVWSCYRDRGPAPVDRNCRWQCHFCGAPLPFRGEVKRAPTGKPFAASISNSLHSADGDMSAFWRILARPDSR